MRINAILNEKEIWLPEYIVKSGQNRKLNVRELLVPEGILIPNSRFMMYYRAIKDKSIKLHNVSGIARLDIVSPAGVVGMYRFSKYIENFADIEHLTPTFRVFGDVDGGVPLAVAANYMFDNGSLKSPKQLLTNLRKHFHNDIPFVRYDLESLFSDCNSLYGEPVKLPTEWDIELVGRDKE